MSQQNVELGHRVFDAVNRRDLDAFLALMDADVEAVPRLAAVDGGYRGHDGMRSWWSNLLDVFPDFTIEIVEARDLGDLTLTGLHLRGRGASGNTPMDGTTWHVSRWRREKCIWWGAFQTSAEALEAAAAAT
jgi:hypothetical protein